MNFASATEALPHLLNKLLTAGSVIPSRNGETRELTMQHITIDQTTDPYITTPGRNVSLPAQIAETMWILAGRNDVEWLANYLPQAPRFSDDGKTWRGGYGPRLRKFAGIDDNVDQLKYIIDLLREDPDTRRAVFTIYDPVVDSRPGKDIPCNNWVHFLARDGKLHAHVAIRSNDAMWGWSGINSFEWSILNQVVAAYAGLLPGTITYDISSLHLYARHYDKAQRIVDQTLLADNELDAGMWNDEFPNESPWFAPEDAKLPLDEQLSLWFELEGDIRERGGIPMAGISRRMPSGLFQDWLLVLNAWWSQEIWPIQRRFDGTSMFHALVNSPKPKRVVGEDGPELAPMPNRWSTPSGFCQSVDRLHRDKGAVYGKSWRKRGETFSILPNVGRKIDRLGVGGAGDSEADTYVDLAVYLAKYRMYLEYGLDTVDDMASPCDDFDMMQAEFQRLDAAEYVIDERNLARATERLKNDYEVLLQRSSRLELVRNMETASWGLARYVAEKEGWEY